MMIYIIMFEEIKGDGKLEGEAFFGVIREFFVGQMEKD